MTLSELIQNCPHVTIADAFLKVDNKLKRYKNIVCSISGGSDSDVMLDIVTRLDVEKKVKYVFFNTGFEYKATLEHLDELEKKYDITIERRRAVKPVPAACKKHGYPFLSKYVSEMIYRLQRNGFGWEDGSYEDLVRKYPKCHSALKWWCNKRLRRDGKIGSLNIARDPYLKEFLIENPPPIPISTNCCEYAKKKTAEKIVVDYGADLSMIGIRKSEGGIRSSRYSTCFSFGEICDYFRPIFWFTKPVKTLYIKTYDVTNSRCYSEYGLSRTGCAGCPFNSDFENELKIIEKYEPQLYKAVNNVFGSVYEYTRAFREYQRKRINEND